MNRAIGPQGSISRAIKRVASVSASGRAQLLEHLIETSFLKTRTNANRPLTTDN
jgi:hypothetical protein